MLQLNSMRSNAKVQNLNSRKNMKSARQEQAASVAFRGMEIGKRIKPIIENVKKNAKNYFEDKCEKAVELLKGIFRSKQHPPTLPKDAKKFNLSNKPPTLP